MAVDPQAAASDSIGGDGKKYKICGIEVVFPYKPYGPQLAYMGKVLAALERSRSRGIGDGSVNALLESPTGSGKTLALLCATLAWQQQYEALPPPPPPPPGDSQVVGGGFIVEEAAVSGNSASSACFPSPKGGRHGKQPFKKQKLPTIYYATRTHSQITQVVREFRKTNYRVPMAVLAARKHYCTNKQVLKHKNVDEDCKELLKDEHRCCPQFKNVTRLKTDPSLQKGGSNEIHDIEDLVTLGYKVKGCAYFAAREMATEAEIVFCPYSYILDPIIRSAMEVNIRGAIIVLDEAHNIEDVAREAGSMDLETSMLEDMRMELEQLSTPDEIADVYSPLLQMVQELLAWIYQQSNSLTKLDFEHFASCWRGDEAVRELQSAGISPESFHILLECSNKAVGAASNPDEDKSYLSGRAAKALEGLFCALKFMLGNNGQRVGDYQLVVKKYVKRNEAMAVSGWVTSISLWCLNPGVVFEEISSAARSIILTSGTLSPMDSFASELGVPFEIQMEASHVVDMDKQVWAATLSLGPGNVPLNASFKNADGYAFQDALGTVLEEICKVVPDGALIFFPSFKLLDKLCTRWQATGQWTRLLEEKQLFVEPKGSSDQFDQVLNNYYQVINSSSKPIKKNIKGRNQKHTIKFGESKEHQAQKEHGAAFLAVCRGKVSEGIDFSDKNARVVIVIGIPFPNVKDIQVTLKKRYNTENRICKNLLSGDQWYCQQTFRALNQAVGRCIRHRYDYGAILLLDERFKKQGNIDYMSKWLRKSIRQCDNFKDCLRGLETFFKKFEVSPSSLQVPIINTVGKLASTRIPKLPITFSSANTRTPINLKRKSSKLEEQSNFDPPGVSVMDFNLGSGEQFTVCNGNTLMQSNDPVIEHLSTQTPACQQIEVELEGDVGPDFIKPGSPVVLLSFDLDTWSGSVTEEEKKSSSSRRGESPSVEEGTSITMCKWNSGHSPAPTPLRVSVSPHCSGKSTVAGTVTQFPTVQSEHPTPVSQESFQPVQEDLFTFGTSPEKDATDTVSNLHTSISLQKVSIPIQKDRIPQMQQSFVSIIRNVDSWTSSASDHLVTTAQQRVAAGKPGEQMICDNGEDDDLSERVKYRQNVSCETGSGSPTGFQLMTTRSGRNTLVALQHKQDACDITKATAFGKGEKSRSFCCIDKGKDCAEHSQPGLCGVVENLTERTETVGTSYHRSEFEDFMEYEIGCIKCGCLYFRATKGLEFYKMHLCKAYLVELCRSIESDNALAERSDVAVFITSSESCHPLLTKSIHRQGASSLQGCRKSEAESGVWVKEDGCVYEALFCPCCENQRNCVGVRIAATDKENLSLMGTIVLFEKSVKLRPLRPTALEKNTQGEEPEATKSAIMQDEELGPNRAQVRTPAKAKLKLQKPKF
ncbi:unnamed protein product [Sphagnum troendelagicum]|uniref:Helicase ATP-binding domain-containing protein n=1 Tax=Sphagnum troendelagicum TaxID=128251 RepID=A0ABP0UJW6_9BRYO